MDIMDRGSPVSVDIHPGSWRQRRTLSLSLQQLKLPPESYNIMKRSRQWYKPTIEDRMKY